MARSKRTNRRGPRPVAILVDRSRDLLAASGLVDLEPDDRYWVTDSRAPLRAAALANCDVLVIAGHAAGPCPARRMRAIADFVRRGGGLLLAASAGFFERYTHRPAAEMAVAAVARRFGIEFVPPGRAAGRTNVNPDLVRGYSCSRIRIHRCRAMRDILPSDVYLQRWSPVRAAGRPAVLMSHRRTGEAAAVSVPFGKGRVLAVGGVSILSKSHRLCRGLIDHLAASGRAVRRARPPSQIFPKYATRRTGNVEVRWGPAAAGSGAGTPRASTAPGPTQPACGSGGSWPGDTARTSSPASSRRYRKNATGRPRRRPSAPTPSPP